MNPAKIIKLFNVQVKGSILICLLLLLNQAVFAQQNIVIEQDNNIAIPKTVILKVQPEKVNLWQELIVSDRFSEEFLPVLGKINIQKAFPNHKPLQSSDKLRNNKLVDLSLIYRLKFQKDFPLDALIFRLNRLGLLEYAEKIYPVSPLFIPNDEKLNSQYYLSRIHAYQAWDICQGDTNTVVGIVDSGTDLDHPDLIGNLKYNYNDPIDGIDNDNDGFIDNFYGWDLGEMDNDPQVIAGGSGSSHGVHMCGIASASTNNNVGVAGAGFKCKFLPIKMNDVNNQYIAGYEGIVYAVDHGCKVVNCSWGGQVNAGKYGQDIINYATFNKDALVIAASGNSNSDVPFYPASYENVLSVGATGSADERMWVSASYATSYGYYLDVCAPGLGIFSTWDYPYFYASMSGTSMASALTSGAAALVRSYFPGYTALQTAEKLRVTADRIDTLPANIGFYEKLGSGRINLFKALTDTVSPSLRILQPHFIDGNDSVFIVGDTIQLRADFYNYLADAHNVTVTIKCLHPGVLTLDSLFTTPFIAASASVNNINDPFKFKILPGIASDAVLMFKVSYDCDTFHSFEFIRLDLNSDYLNIQAQNIKTTLTSRGRIGYNDDWKMQGQGFSYKNDVNRLYSGGFLIGNSYYKVSDVLYNSNLSGWDTDFSPVQKIHAIVPSGTADHEYKTVFNDNNAGLNALGILVTQRTLSWDDPENSRFIIHELTIKNQGTSDLPNLYAGLFADWDVTDQSPDYDRVTWDNDNKMGITTSLSGGPLLGISLVTEGPVKHYAYDNNGMNGSIRLTDGFTSQEKYTALKSFRSQAGTGVFGNNVSDQVSSGPFLLVPGESVIVAFAMMSAEQLTDLQSAAQQANYKYFHADGVPEPLEKSAVQIEVFPNPVASDATIRFLNYEPGIADLIINDPSGRLIQQINFRYSVSGWNNFQLNTENLKPGTYFIQLSTANRIYRTCFIKL